MDPKTCQSEKGCEMRLESRRHTDFTPHKNIMLMSHTVFKCHAISITHIW